LGGIGIGGTMKRPRILLADDHTILLEGLKGLLGAEFELVGTVEDGRALVAAAEQLNPDIILLDISMPLLNGIEAGRQIKKLLPKVKLIYLTMHCDVSFVRKALQVGASGYLLKRSASVELAQAIHSVLDGQLYITPMIRSEVMHALIESQSRPAKFSSKLTPRQREVLQLVAEGRSAKEIAHILGLSVKTVEFHKQRIMEELGVRSTAELTKYAVKHGIVEP
jgi:DNA-binding NarL/FixJ family response regulator